MKKILVPCDFYNASREAIDFAVQMALRSNGEVIVLHTIFAPSMHDLYFDRALTSEYKSEYITELTNKANNEFNILKEGIGDPDIPITFEILYGELIATIKQAIPLWNIDLIIMGTSGASGWDEIFIGSHTEKVIRHAPVPVLTVGKAPKISAINKILLPSLLVHNQPFFMDKVKELQEFFHANLQVLLVNTPFRFQPDAEAKAKMIEFADHYNLRDFELHFVNDWNEELGILNFAQKEKTGMIAMATHSRKGLSHLFNGSIAEDVANHNQCPVWTYSIKDQHGYS